MFPLIAFFCATTCIAAQNPDQDSTRDARVRKFLDEQVGQWHNLNVPYSDGKLLYNIIVKHNYKNALEIGTSTGLSGI